eukprot:6490419-Amphidinium_carterae.5
MSLMDRILQRLEKTDMPRDHHGRSTDLQNAKYPRSILLGLYTKRRVGIARHTASHVDLINDTFYLGESSVISIGNFSGGQLWTESKKGATPAPSTTIDTKGKLTVTRHSWTRLDAANVLHAVMSVTIGGPDTLLPSTLQSAYMHWEMQTGPL